ncbi:hypothetical protein P9112_007385 [Eukaryota sp. TZLM1-RC]
MSIVHTIGYSAKPHSLSLTDNQTCHISGGTLIYTDLSSTEQHFFRGHDRDITAFASSPDGKLAATACDGYNADICVWDLAQKSLKYRLSEHDSLVSALTFSSEGRFLVSLGGHMSIPDGYFFIWDTLTGNYVTSAHLEVSGVKAVAWGGRQRNIKGRETDLFQFVVSSESGLLLVVFDPQSGDVTQSIKPQLGTYQRQFTSGLEFSFDRSLLFAGTTSGDVCLFSVTFQSFSLFTVVPVSNGHIHTLLPYSAGFYAGGSSGSIIGMEVNQSQRSNVIKTMECRLTSPIVDMSCNNNRLLIGTGSGSIYDISLSQPQPNGIIKHAMNKEYQNHRGPVSCVVYKNDDFFHTLSDDDTFRRWSSVNFDCLSSSTIRPSPGASLSMDVGSVLGFVGHEDGIVRCFDAEESGDCLWMVSTGRYAVNSIKLFKNHRYFATASDCLRLFDVRKQSLLEEVKTHRQSVSDVCLFNSDQYAVTVSKDSYVHVVNLSTSTKMSSWKASGPLTSAVLAKDQKSLFVTSSDGTLTHYDLTMKDPVHVLTFDDVPQLTCVDLNPSNNYLAVGSSDWQLSLFDTRSFDKLVSSLGHSGCVRDVSFSPSGSKLVSVGDDSNITMWNV